jgi:hypothetical protein
LLPTPEPHRGHRLAQTLAARQALGVDADDDGGFNGGAAATDQVHQGVEAVGSEGLGAPLGPGRLEDVVGLGAQGGLDAGAHRGGGLALEAVGALGVGAGSVEALVVDAGVAGLVTFG